MGYLSRSLSVISPVSLLSYSAEQGPNGDEAVSIPGLSWRLRVDRDPGDDCVRQAEAAERRLCQLLDKVSGVFVFMRRGAGSTAPTSSVECSFWVDEKLQGPQLR